MCIHAVAFYFVVCEFCKRKICSKIQIENAFENELKNNKKNKTLLFPPSLSAQSAQPANPSHPSSLSLQRLACGTHPSGPSPSSSNCLPLLSSARTASCAPPLPRPPSVSPASRLFEPRPRPSRLPPSPFHFSLAFATALAQAQKTSAAISARSSPFRAVLADFVAPVSFPILPAFFSVESVEFFVPPSPRPRAPASSMAAGHGACRVGAPPAS